MATFRSFAATVRTREGISEDALSAYLKWFKDKLVFAVVEKEGSEKHLHFQVWYDEPKRRVDVDKQVKRIAKRHTSDWDEAQAKHAVKVKVAYNDWYLSYLAENDLKPDDPNIIYNKPPDDTVDYYPTEEEDERMLARASATDQFYHELKEKYDKYAEENEITNPTLRNIARYLHHRQYVQKDMKVTRDSKIAKGMCITLHTYVTGKFREDWWIHQTKQDKVVEDILQSIEDNTVLNLT